MRIVVKFFLFCMVSSVAFGQTSRINIDMEHVVLVRVLRELGDRMHLNLLMSPLVQGEISIHLHNVSPKSAFESILKANDLGQWVENNIVYIAPKVELLKKEKTHYEWQQQINMRSLQSKCIQIRYADAKSILNLIKHEQGGFLSKQGWINVDERTNTLTVRDDIHHLNDITKLIDRLDVPVKQLVINARLLMVDSGYERELGLQFDHHLAQVEAKENNASSAHPPYQFALLTLKRLSHLNVMLAALEKSGHAELISNPYLFTADQQAASIEAGEEVPYQEMSERGGTAVVFKKAVLALRVKPHILPGRKVMLNLQINQDRPSSKAVLGVPTIATHQIQTNVLLKDNETIVLGGIYEHAKENGIKGLPFLHRIPILGWLFKIFNARDNRRELFIFVTPKIMA